MGTAAVPWLDAPPALFLEPWQLSLQGSANPPAGAERPPPSPQRSWVCPGAGTWL